MRKSILLFLLVYGQLFALEQESTLKFYHHILDALFSQSVVSVYVNSSDYKNVFSHSEHIKLVKNLGDADIVLITDHIVLNNVLSLDKKPILFATKYRYLEVSKEVVGGFYWRKGRAQLIFVEDRLKHQEIKLSKEYQKYMVDTL